MSSEFVKGLVFVSLLALSVVAQRPPGPPHPPPPHLPRPDLQHRLADLRHKLAAIPVANITAQRALQYSERYLQRAQLASDASEAARADRLAAAADSFIHIAEHQQHLMEGGGPKGPPPPEDIKEHLQRTYFRTQQADYFLSESHDAKAAAPLPEWARDFYELALRAYDRKQWLAADENAKCADDVVNALENLAQAASVDSVAPPGPPPPPPKPPRL